MGNRKYVIPSTFEITVVLDKAINELECQEDITDPNTDLSKDYRYVLRELKILRNEIRKPKFDQVTKEK